MQNSPTKVHSVAASRKHSKTARPLLRSLVTSLALTLCLTGANAHPYASGVTISGRTVSFILNESATDIQILFDNNTVTNDWGTNVAAGLKSFSLGSHTNFSISVFKLGLGVPTPISPNTNENALIDFVAPRGVNVNRNPQRKNFGRIYVANALNGGDSVRTVGKGVYVLNADFSDALGYGSTAHPTSLPGGAAWGTSPNYAPYKVFVGPDDTVYVADAGFYTTQYTCGEPVWMLDPDLTAASGMFAYIGQPGGTGGVTANAGPCLSTPFVTGSLATGNLKLTCMFWNYVAPDAGGNFYHVYEYNIGSGPIGPGLDHVWTDLPTTLPNATPYGTTPGVVQDLYIHPNGNIFVNQGRSADNSTSLYVYDSTCANMLWSGYSAMNGHDPFVGTYGIAISPDGQYLAGATVSSTFKLCKLTNGIPDLSTLVTNATHVGVQSRGIAFDAANNVYITGGGVNYSGGRNMLEVFSLGLTTTAITSNDQTGTNGSFQLIIPPTIIDVAATVSQASQAGPTPGTFQLTRAGQALNLPLTVNFSLTGTATSDSYSVSPAVGSGTLKSITFAPYETTTNITITPINDGVSRLTTTVILTVQGGSGYTSGSSGAGTIFIQNIGPQQLAVTGPAIPTMYKAFSNDYSSFYIQRLGDTNAPAYTVSSFTYAGTAVAGTDFTLPSVTIRPGDVTVSARIKPLLNGQPPRGDNTAFTGHKSAVIGMAPGTGYTVAPGSQTATLMLLDNVAPPGTAVLYTNSLSNPADAANWSITSGNVLQAPDYDVQFGYDLTSAPNGPIGFPPRSSGYGLRMTANKQGYFSSTGVNAYPTNVSFSGNYSVRFQMNLIQGSQVTTYNEGALFGINHKGTNANWWATDIPAGSGSWQSDGIWFWISSTSGGVLSGDYFGFTGATNLPNTGWSFLAGSGPFSKAASFFTGAFKTAVFSSLAGYTTPAPASGIPGNCSPAYNNYSSTPNPQGNWADVEIKQLNNVITLLIDQTPIFTYTNRTAYTNGFLMLGYDDPVSDVGNADAAVYYANLSVVSLPPLALHITGTALSNGTNVVINFTSTDLEDLPSAFALLTSNSPATVNTPVPATITQLGPGAFQAVVPKTAPMAFYRVAHL